MVDDTHAARHARLSAAKQRLLDRWMRGRDVTGVMTIERRPPGAPLVCSGVQQRLWFLEQLEPRSSVHNLAFAVRWTGALDVDALGGALDHVAGRHEVWRTVFPTVEGRPAPALLPPGTQHLGIEDLRAFGGEAPQEMARRSRAAAHQPFDIARDPLVRVRLWRLADDDHALAVVAHHLVSDGWSMGVFLFELFTVYAAALQARPSPLPPLPIQYGDYAYWQQQRGLQAYAAQREYWRKQLGGELPVLGLPTDHARPAIESTRGGAQPVAIPTALALRLKACCHQRGATLFMALVAAYAALLHRYTGDPELLVGTPVANRPTPELDALIGVFINTVVLRIGLAGEPTLGELLERVREVATAGFAHQDLPFEQLVEDLRPERDFGHAPVFQTMFVFRSSPIPAVPIAGVRARRYPIDSGASRFDVTLIVEAEQDELFAWLEYKAELFAPETMAQLARDYRVLLEALVADPDRRVRDVALVSPADQEQLLGWGRGPALPAPVTLVPARVAAQAAAAPEAIAVVCGSESMTYGALEAAAARLARRLRAAGVEAGVAVPILIERSAQTIVAILGVLKAGGGYVPLDPAQPAERIAAVLRELAPPVVVVCGELAPPPGAARVLPAVQLEAGDPGDAGDAGDAGGVPAIAPEDLAYIIYTSGSTGAPKGVAISHENLAASTAARAACYGAELRPRFLLPSSFAFDSSIAGLFWTLTQGGTLVLPTESAHLDVPRLAALAQRHAVTHLLTLPSVHALLLECAPELPALAAAIVAGEVCPAELVQHHHAQLPAVRLWNEYGPTEATVWATVHECRDTDGGRVPIGRPIAGARLYVLDDERRPVPIGVVGDLWIGGPGVARGYVQRPALTAAAFHVDPWAGVPGARMYGTGDRVRFRRDGALEFWGRRDHQVKLRGHRIELEEIEGVLRGHPAVHDAAVAVHATGAGPLLAAHVVRAPDAAADGAPDDLPAELRAWLQRTLPGSMVPAAVVLVPALPRTSTGKLDRGALAPPVMAATRAGHVAASTALQRTILEAWTHALGVERIGVDDNFFELGGQSFLIMQVHARLTRQLARELPVVALFQYPTVRLLAAYLGDPEAASHRTDEADRRAGRRRLLQRGGRVRAQDGE